MKRITSFLAALLLCLAVAQPAWAASETQVDNSLQTGDVRIAISDELNLGKKTVLPGDKIDYSVSIENQAEPAYIRVRVTELPNWLNTDNITIEQGWDRHGEYYYYKNIVDSKSSVKFINGVTLPDTLGNEMQGAEFKIRTSAEAVQSEHFEPDFSTDDPWFGTVIEVCTDEDAYDPGTTGEQSFQVIYEDGSKGLIHVGDDFFANWDRLMPGDVMTGTVEIKNNYSPAEIFFRTENIIDGADSGEDTVDGGEGAAKATSSDLLAQLNLKIENDNQVIYDGPMSGIASPTSLGDYSVGSSTKLTYTVTMPAKLQNAYSLTDTVTRWIFSVKPSGTEYEFPKTGGPGIYGYIAAGAACMMLTATAVTARKKGSADHE